MGVLTGQRRIADGDSLVAIASFDDHFKKEKRKKAKGLVNMVVENVNVLLLPK